MGKFRRLDTSPGWQKRETRDLRRKLQQERAAKRAAATTVGSGGSFAVSGLLSVVGLLDVLGNMSIKSDLVEIFRIGDMTYGDRGFEIKREDGSSALLMRKPFDPTNTQQILMLDRNGEIIVGENSVGPGLNRPHLDLPFQPVSATPGTPLTCGPYGIERTTTSSTFETVFTYDGKAQNYNLDLKFAAHASDATTAGEIQVVDLASGTPRPGFFLPPYLGVIPAGTTTPTILDPDVNSVLSTLTTVGVGGVMRLGVQIRRTAGSGTITVAVPSAIGG